MSFIGCSLTRMNASFRPGPAKMPLCSILSIASMSILLPASTIISPVVDFAAGFNNNFTGSGINQRLVKHFVQQAAAPAEFFVQLVAAYTCKVIAFVVEEGCFNQLGGVFQCRRFARAQLFVNFNQRFFAGASSRVVVVSLSSVAATEGWLLNSAKISSLLVKPMARSKTVAGSFLVRSTRA